MSLTFDVLIHPQDPTLKYPYVRDELPPPEVMIANLSRSYFAGEFNINRNLNILTRFYEHFKDDSVSCHFTEDVRARCRQLGAPNYVDIWEETSPEILRGFKTVDEFRWYCFVERNAKECGLFSPVLGMHLYLDYRRTPTEASVTTGAMMPIKILDTSAGWGDRMIAAIACGDAVSEYHGYDPSPELEPRYREIIDRLDIDRKCTVTRAMFEEAKIPKGYYDLAMTSPPYYNLEIYSDDKDQSTSRYKTYKDWLKYFYTPYLLNMRYGVKAGGTIIIYVSDYTLKGVHYSLEEDTINILTRRSQGVVLRLRGELKTTTNKQTRPFYVFDVNV